MSFVKQLLSASAAAALISGASSAQVVPIDYTNHWQPMHGLFGGGLIASDAALFTPAGFVPSPAGVGDSIRRCFGTDTTNGGRNQSTGAVGGPAVPSSPGLSEFTWFRLVQGYGATSTTQAAEAGILSMHMASDSDLTGDVCFSPWFPSVGNTGGHVTTVAAIVGTWGQPGQPVPTFWILVGQWAGSSATNFHGVPGPNAVGTQPAGPFAGIDPLLANAIFEVQGPANSINHQYYIATTAELTGLGSGGSGTGGVTNGNGAWGSGIFGGTADLTGAVNHTRIMAYDDPAQGGSGALTGLLLVPQTEVIANVAWHSPGLWGINNGNEGAGGNDWVVSTSPLSTVDLRLQDNLSGAQTNSTDSPVAFDPAIVFNQPVFVWSATPALGMQERPMSWDDLGGALPAKAGSIIIGGQITSREGVQRIPANFDAATSLVLGFSGLTLGTPFTNATDFFLDGAGTFIFQDGLVTPIAFGVSHFSGGPTPLVGTPKPGLAGKKLGIAAIGVQVHGVQGVRLTEVANSLEISLQ